MSLVPLQFRGDLADRWTKFNPVLKDREVGLEEDTQRFKVGDGRTKWNDLAYWISGVFEDVGDPTGFLDNENIDVSYDSTTRKITLTHSSGYIWYYYKGVKKVLESPWISDAHDVTTTAKYLYSTDGENFTWSDTPWSFTNIMVAFVAPNKIFAVREVHGVMASTVHEELHRNLSTYRLSGFGLTSGTYVLQSPSDANNSPSFDAGIIVDEDLKTDILAFPQGTYTCLQFTGVGVSGFYQDSYIVGEILGDYPQYNPFNGTSFSSVEMATNQYANIYVLRFPVTSDTESQKYRAVCLAPQFIYTTLASAQAEDFRSLYLGDLGNLSPEFVAVERITIRTNASYVGATGQFRLEAIAILTGSRASQTSVTGFTSLTAENVSFTPVGSITSVNVQDAIAEADTQEAINSASVQSVVDADYVPFIDVSASNSLVKLAWSSIKSTLATYFNTLYDKTVTAITGSSAFGTLSDTDYFPYTSGSTLYKKSWSSLKATLKTYFDTLYAPIALTNGYNMTGGASVFSMTPTGTPLTYYWGASPSSVPTTIATAYRMYFPKSGTIKAIVVGVYHSGSSGLWEVDSTNWIMKYRYNNGTGVDIVSGGRANQESNYFTRWANYSLNVAVTAGSYIEIQEVSPDIFLTNPVNCYRQVQIYVET